MDNQNFCESLTSYQRFETREVMVGNVGIGGSNPIRLQSMTTADTMDTEATIAESIRLIEAGAELVRITAPSKKDAENLALIKKGIRDAGYDTPLVADIHFTPNAAEIAARIVEKVRINPGNFADKKKFEQLEFNDDNYAEELERIRKKFTPLIAICKEHKTAMRIGTNHGSLSDRIMSRYGDTPLGMVESAMEFLRIAESLKYYDIILSMKASNPQVMVQAYRLLIQTMKKEGMNYPLHLGVTEAGEGEDGRIKSAMGIGLLLEDGLGDTIRVSLTEDPELELPVCQQIAERYKNRKEEQEKIPAIDGEIALDFLSYSRRKTRQVFNFGDEEVPRIIADFNGINVNKESLKAIGFSYLSAIDKWGLSDSTPDYLYVAGDLPEEELPTQLKLIVDYSAWKEIGKVEQVYPFLSAEDYLKDHRELAEMKFLSISLSELKKDLISLIQQDQKLILVLESENAGAMQELRRLIIELDQHNITQPIILKRSFNTSLEKTRLYSATDIGGLLLDGAGDGIWIDDQSEKKEVEFLNSTAFGILQASRTRISRTEYIACPSCGRTLFNLQETTAKIKSRTSHLKGVKIGIMGCIVNGPGEMADADFGYVGSGVGKITLYRGKEVVERNLAQDIAVDALIDLIKEHDMWVEPTAEIN